MEGKDRIAANCGEARWSTTGKGMARSDRTGDLARRRTVETSANPIYPESDPRHHTAKVKKVLDDLAAELRENTVHFADPTAQSLFESSAEVLEELRDAFDHYEIHAGPPSSR
jgi:hypothetical protein